MDGPFALKILPSIYQLGSNFVKHLFRIQIQKDGNRVKARMEACYSELILAYIVALPYIIHISNNLSFFKECTMIVQLVAAAMDL